MSLDPCALPQPPVIVQGEDKVLDIVLRKQLPNGSLGDPVDLTAATEIEAILLNTDGTFLEKKLTTSGITLISGPGGHFQISISAAQSALLAASVSPAYSDIEVHFVIASKTTISIITNAVNIIPRRYPTAP